ncbi:MAG TPA: ABC transporter permease [Terracidiphilus sp.]|nr:ABC transporter permease [Terracidiphilus sp.]
MFQDIRYAVRQLRKSPGFALTAMVTLALGIGANAIVFSVLNALVLHPLNVPQAQSLYMVQRVWQGSEPSPSQSYPDYLDLRDRNHSFESLATYDIIGGVGVNTGGGTASVAWPYLVSGNYFEMLGVRPYLGRFFSTADEHGDNSMPYIVLSYAYWKHHFEGDRNVVGSTVEVNGHAFTVLGVTPQGFRGTELFFAPAFYVPVVDISQIFTAFNPLHARGDHFTWVVGHLKPGVTPKEAAADLNTIAAELAKTYPKDDAGLNLDLTRPGLVGDTLGRPARAFMLGLTLLAGLILLAACANLGSLFAARAADRSREIAVRMALGSRRGLVVRQLLTEALLVSLGGGALGLYGSVAILRWLSAWNPIPDIPINVPVNPDLNTYMVALGLALASGFLFGMVPVRQVLRADPWQIIRSGSLSATMRRFTVRDLLLVVQIAICAVLITSSLVAVRGLARSLHSNFGFEPRDAMLAQADLGMAGITGDQQQIMEKKMLTAVAGIPGVTTVGYADRLPLSVGGNDSCVFYDKDADFRPTNCRADAQQFNVSPQYFKAAETTMLAGRTFTLDDAKGAPLVAVVNREFARKIFGSVQKAIGKDYKIWSGTRVQVVGVVENGKYTSLTEDQQPAMFYSFLQQPSGSVWLVVRSRRDAESTAAALHETLRGLAPGLPVRIETWDRELSFVLFPARVATVALGVLGLLGAMLAITGIFGMASYVVSKRMRELGIRVALGANQREVLQAALGRPFRLLALGSAAGILLGMLATKLLSYIVYQATPKDPLVLGCVIVTMLLLGLVAASIPARRALAVDPMILLREE